MSAQINSLHISEPDPKFYIENYQNKAHINNQLIYFSSAVQERFHLHEDERLRLTKYYEFESQTLNDKNILRSASNWLMGQVRYSEGDYVEDMLRKKAINVIKQHYIGSIVIDSIEAKAIAVSKFILNYLITLNAMVTDQPIRKISDYQWTTHRMHEITIDNVLDQAVNGNGTDFGVLEVADILGHIQHKYQELQYELTQLSNMALRDFAEVLRNEYNLQMKKDRSEFESLRRMLVADPKRFSGSAKHLYDGLNRLRTECEKLKKLRKRIDQELIGV